ncbi:MAG: RDD family protein [Pseudomonadota bacterium]
MASTAPETRTNREEFTVQGMTGVDLSLPVAGPGSRSYAFIIDWHIRLVMAIAWFVAGLLISNGSLRFRPGMGALASALIFGPALIFYFLYHPIVELTLRGQTPGKRIAGVRVVNREGGPPSAGAVLIRNAFRLIDSMPMFYSVGLVCTFVTNQRVRIGDMAAGTLLVVIDTDTTRTIDRIATRSISPGFDPATMDLAEQLLERWKQIDRDKRGAMARSLLKRLDMSSPQTPDSMNDAELHTRLQSLMSGKESH